MHKFLDGKDYIKYVPVCSKCGEPIKEYEVFAKENLYESDSEYKCKDYKIHPSTCKKCGAHFEYIVDTIREKLFS